MKSNLSRTTRRGCSLLIVAAAFMLEPLASAAQTASNRATADAFFTEPRGTITTQMVYTLADAVAAYYLKPDRPANLIKNVQDSNEKILAAANSATLSDAEKIDTIEKAATQKAKASASIFEDMLASGTLNNRLIRGVRWAGTTWAVADAAGRWYVWNELNADPTWSPIWQAMRKLGNGLSTDNALAGH